MSTAGRFLRTFVLLFVVSLTVGVTSMLADGTETLGPQAEVQTITGTGIIAAGIGLDQTNPANITFTLPAGAVVKKAFIYWEGQTLFGGSLDHNFTLNGKEIDASDPGDASDGGDRIGEPIFFFSLPAPTARLARTSVITNQGVLPHRIIRTQVSTLNPADVYAIAYRYDITGLNLIVPGPNTLTIADLNGFGYANDGAGVLVVYEVPGLPQATIDIRDGIDLAFAGFTGARQSTVAQTFTFPAATLPRTATLSMFFSSVEGTKSGFGFRPTSIEITVGGNTTILSDLLNSNDGPEWDTQNLAVVIPPGATSLTVRPFSRDDHKTGRLPASFFWLAAGLSVPPPPQEGGEGCTPGYWKQSQHFGSWPAPYTPSTLFGSVFENAFPGKTLLQVLGLGGGGLNALGRHTVAALLNAQSSQVAYDLGSGDVIDMFNAVFPGNAKNYEDLKSVFAGYNERNCPLGRAELAAPTVPGSLENYPNPFNPETSIRFSLETGADVQLHVYNTLGQLVKTLASGWYESGAHAIRWDGRNDAGNSLSSGMYICQLRTGSTTKVLKLNLIR